MPIRTTTIATAAALTLAACAPGPDSIAPVPAPAGAYAGLSCAQLYAEERRVSNNLTALESQQRGAQAGDAFGVFLIGVPMSSLTGGDRQGVIAAEKGKAQALAARINNTCP